MDPSSLVKLIGHRCARRPIPVCPFQHKKAASHRLQGVFFSQSKGLTIVFCSIFQQSLGQLKCLLEFILGTWKLNCQCCQHHTWSSMSPSKADPHPLFDHRQHRVCSRRLILHIILLYPSPYFRLSGWNLAPKSNLKKRNKKLKVCRFQRIGFDGSPCRKEALADTEDGFPSFVWTTRKPPASSVHHSVSQCGASDPAWHPPCRRLHCQLPSILPSIPAIYLQILLCPRRADNTQLRFQE